MIDNDEFYWMSLAKEYDLKVDSIKIIYATWNPDEYESFGDYVEAIKKDAGLVA